MDIATALAPPALDNCPGVDITRVRPLFRLTHGTVASSTTISPLTPSAAYTSSPTSPGLLLLPTLPHISTTTPTDGIIYTDSCGLPTTSLFSDETIDRVRSEESDGGEGGEMMIEEANDEPQPRASVNCGGGSSEELLVVGKGIRKRRGRAPSIIEDWDTLEDIPVPRPVTLSPHVGSARDIPTGAGVSGSNAVISPRDSMAFEFSTGELIECECCVALHESVWCSAAAQRIRKRILVALARGWFDANESSSEAIAALSQIPLPGTRAARIARKNAEAAAVAVAAPPMLTPPPPYAAALTLDTHARIRARLMRDVLDGRLVAEFSEDKPVLWILVASEWERRVAVSEEDEAMSSARGTRGKSSHGMTSGHENDEFDEGEGGGSLGSDDGDSEVGAGAGSFSSNKAGGGSGGGGGGIPKILQQIGNLSTAIIYRIILVDVATIAAMPVPMDAPSMDTTTATSSFSLPHAVSFGSLASSAGAPALIISTNLPDTSSAPSSSSTGLASSMAGGGFRAGGGGGVRTSGRTRTHTHKHYKINLGIGQQPFTRAAVADLLVRLRYSAPSFIESSDARGRYVCAGGFIPRGAIFCEYGGQLVSATEGNVREGRYAGAGNALYGCYSYFFAHPTTRVDHCCDATAERIEYGIGRLFSHSKKSPNLHVSAVLIDGVPRLVLSANKDIVFGAELYFDYGDRRSDALESFAWLKA